MNYSNWEQFGDKLKNSIWEAVETGNFSSLSQTVAGTIDQAIDSVTGRGGTRRSSKKIFASVTGAKTGASIMAWLGGGMAALFLLTFISQLFDPWATASELASIACCTVAFGAVSVAGFRKRGLVKRYQRYVCLLEGHEYYDVKLLADQSCRSIEEVRKDLKTMIIRGWFRQGYLDKSGTCLMLTEQAYNQYLALMDQSHRQKEEAEEQERLRRRAKEREAEERARKEAAQAKTEEERRQKEEELRRKEEEARRKEEERYANLPEEVRDIIRTGNEYIEKVHRLNDEIPGEEVTAKISRMELLLDRIFDRVEHHPESASDVRRLMDYYLPMTVKLLEAYRDMDAQPIQLSNISSSKQEIEKTLDTLNSAFEKLLDDLFTSTAWDLSSDISVLNTLLAQDGLAGKDIKQKEKTT